MVKPMKQKGKVPKTSPSVPDGSEVSVSLIQTQGEKLSRIYLNYRRMIVNIVTS